jgi:AraC-like DNA-binding protein
MSSNICKFNFTRSSDLVCHDFVLETQRARADALQSDRFVLGLCVGGEGELIKNGGRYPLRVGTAFCVLRSERYAVDGGEGLEYCYVTFSGRRAEELLERIGVDTDYCVFDAPATLAPFWLNALHMADAGNTDLLAESVLLYTLAHLRPNSRPQSDVIARILSLTDDRLTDAELSLSALARELGYDAKYLSTLFKKRKGVPYTQYLRDLRIRHAIFLMEQGVVSVKNVALLCGFGDALYFSKVFTKVEGVSPKAYIAALAAREEE